MLAQKANLEANEDYYAHARDRYEQGVDSFLLLLDAQRSLYSSRQNYLTLNLARLANQVDFYKVLGGGWQERTD
jgi:multidrug efflux system outer membrane protein